ncbi:phage antirepressor KilAC domain-containing protein, partial [Comamonas aquatilis]|uniref:phage antirepressor KilAC domain-containing protein n=1 Tax=Comamonas aquatilis TaxID=1778406 RepID=UPI0039EE927F
ELGLDPLKFQGIYLDGMNRQQTEFHLPRELTDTLLTGYSAALRLAVVRRWHELEAQQAPKLPQTMAQALRLAAEQAEQIEAQQEQLALAAPKVEYVDRYVAANGSMGFRQVAKLLQANEHEFRAWMQDEKVMYRLGNEWTAYQNHIEAGRFVVRAGVASANDHAFNTTKFTPKGVEWVAGLWGKHKAALALDSGVQA